MSRRSVATSGLFGLVVGGGGTAFALNSIAVTSIPPLWVAAIRATVACLIFVAIAGATQRPISLKSHDVATYIVVGTTTGIVPFFLLAWGQMTVPSSLAGVMFASVPLMTVFMSWVLFQGTRPTVSKTLGATLGLIGVAMAFPVSPSTSSAVIFGAFGIMVAAISYAFGGLFLQRAKEHDPFALMAGQFFVSAIVLIIAAMLWAKSLPAWTASSAHLSALAVGITGSALPLICFLMLLRSTDVVVASNVTFFVPFVAISVGYLALEEGVSLQLMFGFALCMFGSLLVTRSHGTN